MKAQEIIIMFDYILFDLDGTLTDPKEGITKSVQFALNRNGIHEPDLDRLEPFIGPPLKDSFMEFYDMSEEEAEEAVAHYRERFQAIGLYENKVYPGMAEMLRHLRAAGKKLAVASSKPQVFVERILKYFKLDSYFDVVVGSELDGRRGRKEEVVEEALRQLEGAEVLAAAPEEGRRGWAMVGDRKFDIHGARQFGLTAVAVSYGYAGAGELEEAGADYIVSSVPELEALLLGNRQTAQTPAMEKKDSWGMKRIAESPFQKTWSVLFPFLLYYLGNNLCYMLMVTLIQFATRSGSAADWLYENSVLMVNVTKAVSMLAGMAMVWPLFCREKAPFHNANPVQSGGKLRTVMFYLNIVLLAVSSALGVNVFFYLLGITGISARYSAVLASQFQTPVLQGILLFGLVAPVVEEVVFRGVIYNRLKRYFSGPAAILVSAFIFGGYHGNLVQGAYGFIMGVLIAWVYERTGSFGMPVLFHAAANISVFLLTYDSGFSARLGTPFHGISFLLVFLVCWKNMFAFQNGQFGIFSVNKTKNSQENK